MNVPTQVGTFYCKVLTEEEKIRLCKNIAGHLKDAQEFIQKRAVSCWDQLHPDTRFLCGSVQYCYI